MKRSIMQIYSKKSNEALDFYKKVFPDAVETCRYLNDDETIAHAELTLFGNVIAIAQWEKASTGYAMQFCFQFDETDKHIIDHAYEMLKEEGEISSPLGPIEWSPYMTALIDKYGVNWCLFI